MKKLLSLMAAIAILLCWTVPAFAAIPANEAPKAVTPIVERVTACTNAPGTYSALMGYSNPNSDVVNIPVGSATNSINKFTPTPDDRGQPVDFLVGRQYGVFQFLFDGGNQVWSLRTLGGGRTATASGSASNVRQGECVLPTP
jgi:hypothetical protein